MSAKLVYGVRILVLAGLILMGAGLLFGNPFTVGSNPTKWPVGTILNVYIAEDPNSPPDRAALVKEGIERWVEEMARRGITINVNTGTAPAGTENVIPVTWVDPGTVEDGSTYGTDMDGYAGGASTSSGTLVSGDIKLVKGLDASDDYDKNYIKNLAQHEMSHVLGLDHDDVDGDVTSGTQGGDADRMPNDTDLDEVSTLYPVDPNYIPPADPNDTGGEKAFSGYSEYPEYLFSKAKVTAAWQGGGDWAWLFEHSGATEGHIPLIILYGLDNRLIRYMGVSSGWEILNPADPLSRDPGYPYYAGRYVDNNGGGFNPFDPAVELPVAIRAVDAANALSVDNPSVLLFVSTRGGRTGTFDLWAGGHGDTVAGPVWEGGYTVSDFEDYQDSLLLLEEWQPIGNSIVELTQCYAREGLNAMQVTYNDFEPGETSAVFHAFAGPLSLQEFGLVSINVWVRFPELFDPGSLPFESGLFIELQDFAGMTGRVYFWADDAVGPEGGYWRVPLDRFADVDTNMLGAILFGHDSADGTTDTGPLTVLIDDIVIAGPQCLTDIVGDFNKDCVVDLVDFAVFANGWLETAAMWP